MKGFLSRTRRWALIPALLLSVLGSMLVLRQWRHMGKHQWEPLVVPLTITEGQTANGQFTAELSEDYEVELKIDWSLPNETLDRLIYISEGTAPLDIQWNVRHGQKIVAQGDCRDYLYLSEGGHYRKSKINDALLNIPFHRQSSTGTLSRGVGRFQAEAANTYQVSVKVNASIDELNVANPRWVIRLSRAFWTRHLDELRRSAYVRYIFLAIAGASFLWFLLGTLCQRNISSS